MIYNQILQLIDEANYIISSDNKIYNKDNLPIFIYGFSGSGKSTIGRELAKSKNLKYFEEDSLVKEFSENNKISNFQQIIDYLISFIINQKSNKFVYDGVYIYDIINGNNSNFLNYLINVQPQLILINTSYLNSSLRSAKRDVNEYDDLLLSSFVRRLRFNYNIVNPMKQFQSFLINNNFELSNQ